MKESRFILIACLLMSISSCDKNDNDPPPGAPDAGSSLELAIRFQVDGAALEFDTLGYVNHANNQYSVQSLMFYISQLSLIREDSTSLQLKDWIYVDAQDAGTLNISLINIPAGCYKGLRFNAGIDSAHNIPYGLPATAENLMMEWPVMMGGGYHFLKLEGYFADSSGNPGYAMHTGTNSCLTSVFIPVSLCFQGSAIAKTLFVNVNEWFRTPETFDFNTDGNYIMGDTQAMVKIAANGKDAFTIQ